MPSYIVTVYLMSRNYFLCPLIGEPYLAKMKVERAGGSRQYENQYARSRHASRN
jgi:hypothetical protein